MRIKNRILDSIVLAYIRRRLARFRKRGDIADRFADRLTRVLWAEMQRRDKLLAGWDADEHAAAERERRAAAVENFQSFEPGDGLRLQ
jgi:hypothetical protein